MTCPSSLPPAIALLWPATTAFVLGFAVGLAAQRAWFRRKLRRWQIELYDAEAARSLASERLLTSLAAGMVRHSNGSTLSAEEQKLYNELEVKHAEELHNLLATMRRMP